MCPHKHSSNGLIKTFLKMNQNKKDILSKIRNNKPQVFPLSDYPDFKRVTDLVKSFKESALAVGSKIFEIKTKDQLAIKINELFSNAKIIASTLPYFPGNINLLQISKPSELKKVDVAVIETQLGVAENSSVWISESNIHHRVLPFLAQHLVVLIDSNKIVENMHVAYDKIKIDEDGYGVFIAGPSKTADIEQSLVIGAQGPRSNTILIHNGELSNS
jgi:L-lactate dehydrogenase complex protein LldG